MCKGPVGGVFVPDRKEAGTGLQRMAQRRKLRYEQKADSARLWTVEGLWAYNLLGTFVGGFEEGKHRY